MRLRRGEGQVVARQDGGDDAPHLHQGEPSAHACIGALCFVPGGGGFTKKKKIKNKNKRLFLQRFCGLCACWGGGSLSTTCTRGVWICLADLPVKNGMKTDAFFTSSGRVVHRSGMKSLGCSNERESDGGCQCQCTKTEGKKKKSFCQPLLLFLLLLLTLDDLFVPCIGLTSEQGIQGHFHNYVSRDVAIADPEPFLWSDSLETARHGGTEAKSLVDARFQQVDGSEIFVVQVGELVEFLLETDDERAIASEVEEQVGDG